MGEELKKVQDKIKKFKSLKEYDIEDFVKFGADADKITQEFRDTDIKTSQLRKFFAAVKEIELYLKNNGGKWDETARMKFYLLMPKIAYAKGRKVISPDFYKLMEITMSKVGSAREEDTLEDFKRFVQFLEAIVAFYKVNKPKSQ